MISPASMPTPDAHPRRTLWVIFVSRFALNIPLRIMYPFLPAIARGFGVGLESASLLATTRALASSLSPLFGVLADRYGRRTWMLFGLAALVLGAGMMASVSGLPLALVAFVVLGLSKASYDPALIAYVGDTVPYAKRGRTLGLLETPWAMAWLVGVPAAGYLIAAAGWRSPFWAIAGLGAVSLWLTWRFCARVGGRGAPPRPAADPLAMTVPLAPFSRRWAQSLLHHRSAIMALAVNFLLIMANENILIVYGAWMESEFGLALTALGIASMGIAVVELIGEVGSAGVVDRVGKRRSVFGGLLLHLFALALLPRLAGSLAGALVGMASVLLTFEFSIVSMLPLVSELAPGARGTVMALSITAMSFARAIGSLTGPRLWELGGLTMNARASAALVAVALALLTFGVRERRDRMDEEVQPDRG